MSTGQCLCGNVKYETNVAPTVLGVCHCKNCQRQGGSAFSTIAGIALSELHINGVPKLYEDSNTFTGNTVKRFLALVAYINNSAYWGPRMMSEIFDELVNTFISALRLALPHAKDRDIYWCYHNLSGALTLTLARTGRIDRLSGGTCHSDDFKSAYDYMIPFVAAGFREVCAAK